MLIDVFARRRSRSRRECVNEQSFAAGLHELAQRLECGIAVSVLIGRDDGLGGTGARGQFGLSQPMPSSNLLKELSGLHFLSISTCL